MCSFKFRYNELDPLPSNSSNHHKDNACHAIFIVRSYISAILHTFCVAEYVRTSIGFAAFQISIYSFSELTGTPPPFILSFHFSPKFDWDSCDEPIDKISKYPACANSLHHPIYFFTHSSLVKSGSYGPECALISG